MEPTEEEMIEWLRVLALPEDEFRRAIRPYFADTGQMNMYIEERRPQELLQADPVPTRPFLIEELESGRYKGRHGKR
jgi:hypothetical protein